LRELLRGYSSLLHNLAVALKAQRRVDDSLEMSGESFAVSELRGDVYRIGQSRNHQALLKPAADRAPAFEALSDGEWRRGSLIAKQQLVGLAGGEEGSLGSSPVLISPRTTATGGTGMDIDLYASRYRSSRRSSRR
jgi:hypothetical protein